MKSALTKTRGELAEKKRVLEELTRKLSTVEASGNEDEINALKMDLKKAQEEVGLTLYQDN